MGHYLDFIIPNVLLPADILSSKLLNDEFKVSFDLIFFLTDDD